MFSQLGDKLQDIFKDLRGHGTISEANVDEALRQVRLAMLEADVDFQVAKRFMRA
jgi:signal recognition particle subunit SRP54